jgi:hypothetical protein
MCRLWFGHLPACFAVVVPNGGERGSIAVADYELPDPDRLLLEAVLARVDGVLLTDEALPGESRSTFAVAADDDELIVKLDPVGRKQLTTSDG